MTIAVTFGGEEQGAMGTFEGFLTGMCKNVTTQGAGPWEHTLTVRAGDAIGSHAVGGLFLWVFSVCWTWIVCARVVAFGSTSRRNETFFVAVVDVGGISRTTVG